MDDVFIEKIVARKKTGKDYLLIAGVIIGGLAAIVAVNYLNIYVINITFMLPLVVVGVIYLLYILISNMSIEFEYILTNGDLDIDQIIARRKRKRVFSCQAKNIELMARVGSDEWRDAERGGYKRLDCSQTLLSPDNWFITANYKGQRLLVVFTPDERMLKNMKRYNPSKIKYVQSGL